MVSSTVDLRVRAFVPLGRQGSQRHSTGPRLETVEGIVGLVAPVARVRSTGLPGLVGPALTEGGGLPFGESVGLKGPFSRVVPLSRHTVSPGGSGAIVLRVETRGPPNPPTPLFQVERVLVGGWGEGGLVWGVDRERYMWWCVELVRTACIICASHA